MVTIKILKSNPDKQGDCPVVIQANHDYKTKRRTLFRIDPKLWQSDRVRKYHPDHVALNRLIRETLNEFEQRQLDLQMSGIEYDVDDLFTEKKTSDSLHDTIISYVENCTTSGKNHFSIRKYHNLATWVGKYDDRVKVEAVGAHWINRFRTFLESQESINSTGTINRYIGSLQTVLRDEMMKGRGIDLAAIHLKPKPHRVVKEPLTRKEFKEWCEADVEGRQVLYRDFFAALVYLRGLRVGDGLQLKYSDVVDGRIRIREQKTDKYQRIAIIPELQMLLDRYAGQSKWYLFPILKQIPNDPKTNYRYRKHIQSKTAVLNNNFKVIAGYAGIKKKVTNHIARHTFTSFADRAGLDSRTISKMLNHSSPRVTENYMGDMRRPDELDEAARQIFG